MGVSLVRHLHVLPCLTLGESIFQGSYSLTAEDCFTESLSSNRVNACQHQDIRYLPVPRHSNQKIGLHKDFKEVTEASVQTLCLVAQAQLAETLGNPSLLDCHVSHPPYSKLLHSWVQSSS